MPFHGETGAPRIRRRQFLRGAALASVVGAAPGAVPKAGSGHRKRQAGPFSHPRRPNYDTAIRETARWICAVESKDAAGVWVPEPDHPEIKATVSPPDGFYSGDAGTVLFFVELARATDDKSYWDDAKRGGNYLIRSWRETAATPSQAPGAEFSLYTGLAGTIFALAVLWKATRRCALSDCRAGCVGCCC